MVVQLSWSDIIDLLRSVKIKMVLIMPAIHEEWIDTIFSIDDQTQSVEFLICVDNSETVIRNGYGSEKSILRLKEKGIDVKECDDLRVNFISVDDRSYCLFMESRILEGNPKGFNAIQLNKENTESIIKQFFPDPEFENDTDTIGVPLNQQKFEKIQHSLKQNPPSQPDLKRQINTYKTHFQYAEIHFEGANLKNKTITIPKEALPFKDADLKKRMKTSFNLFTEEDADQWSNLDEINIKILEIRTKFLNPCNLKRGRSILKKENKKDFLDQIEELKKLVAEKTRDLSEDVQKAINNSKSVLRKEMQSFFSNNLPEEIDRIKDNGLRNEELDDMISKIIVKTKIPKAYDLINKMSVETQFAEFTEEDLNNKDFLKWFKEKKLITEETENELAKFEKAYRVMY